MNDSAALILNDYFDLEIDRVNAPLRPLPAGLVTQRDVLVLIPIATMDVVIGYSVIRLLDPATSTPRAHIRAIYLSGLVAVLGFIGIRLIL